jgi:hypothetical protein
MQMRRLSLALLLSLVFPLSVAHAGNPIPGVGIVVKKCKCQTPCCLAARLSLPGGFFGPGSPPVDVAFGMQGREDGTPDSRIDYAADDLSGPFDMSMQRMKFFTSEPIAFGAAGGISAYDVQCDLSGPDPGTDDPLTGELKLHSGDSDVLDSFLDGHCVFTFHDHTTGEDVGTPIEMDAHLVLQNTALPIVLIPDGTPTGHIALGFDGAAAVPFTYSSAGNELVIVGLSLQEGPVATQPSTWGAVKALYR